MKQEQIIDAISLLPEEILEETNTLRAKNPCPSKEDIAIKTNHSTITELPGKRTISYKWIAVAACGLLLLCGGLILTTSRLIPDENVNEIPTNLAMLTITTKQPLTESGGGGGFQAYDISEWVNNNPWHTDAELSTLPVYRNQLTYNDQFQVQGTDFEKMESLLLDVIDGLGLNAEDFDISDDAPSAYLQQVITEKLGGNVPDGYFNPTKMLARGEDILIEVSADLTAKISFEPAVALPDKYQFTHFTSYEDVKDVADYLKKTYRDVISFKKPQANIYGGDYNNVLQQSYHIEFFEGKGTLTEQIINYNFNRVAFYCDDKGKLFLARVFRPDLSEKVGDYPIISVEEATEQLLAGRYYYPSSFEHPNTDYISKVELIYRTGQYEEYFMPYYLFYVELPKMEREGGLKTFGLYFVPAVEEKYITNSPEYYPYVG